MGAFQGKIKRFRMAGKILKEVVYEKYEIKSKKLLELFGSRSGFLMLQFNVA